MFSYKNKSVIAAIVLVFSSALFAAESAPAQPQEKSSEAAIAQRLAEMTFPQLAEVTGDNVYIRSGPGTSYYYTTKAQKGDKVTVVDILNNTWAKILPPEGSYSWISKMYVDLSPDNPKIGVVTGDDVRVWAGSDYVEPLHSHSQQAKLYKSRQGEKGDVVELIGSPDENADYYKIKPPLDVYLFISMEYLNFLGPVTKDKPAEAPSVQQPVKQTPLPQEFKPAETQPGQAAQTQQPQQKPEAKPEPPKPTLETMALQKTYDIAKEIDQELAKPLPQQNYSQIRQTLQKLIETPEIGKAQTHAQILLGRIDRYELAASVNKQLAQQEENLQQTRSKIEKAHKAQLEKAVPREARFMFVGTLKPSHIYTGRTGSKRYLITDSDNKILAYLLPTGAGVQSYIDSLVDQKVGINGTVLDDPKAIVTTVLVEEVTKVE